MPKYSKFPENLPPDGVVLWIDRSCYIGEAFKATYNSVSGYFTSVNNSIVYPAYFIVRWRLA
jgi:hypothetical protein